MKTLQAMIAAFAMTASMAQAADIYGGIALDYGRPHSGEARQHGTVLVGTRISSQLGFFAAEADVGADFGDADYSTLRARGIYGTSFGNFVGFGSLGGTLYRDNGKSYTSLNAGIGAEKNITSRLRVRGEIIRDFMPNYTTSVTVLRAGLVQDF